ncbi:MAG: hypothetical protein HGA35_00620 [Erysipelotrichaceae bacterium]|nr:hypothetical protein [Erysipelotrichaceae bacterium]
MFNTQDITLALQMTLSNNEDYVHSIKFHEDNGYAIQSLPIDVGKRIYEGPLSTSASTVFTSATLTNLNGDTGVRGIEWMTGYTYLDGSIKPKLVTSTSKAVSP